MPVMEVIGWSLVHSVWQGLVVAAVLWVVLRVVHQRFPRARYVAGLVALALLVVLPVLTYRQTVELWTGHRVWLVETADRLIRVQMEVGGPADAEAVTAELRRLHAAAWPGDRGVVARVARAGREPVRVLAWAWLAGVLVSLGRLAVHRRRASRLADGGRPDERWRVASARVGARLGLTRPVRVRVSDRVEVPALVGWRWPVVLVPPAASVLPEPEVEAVLAHELAHVRRHDYLANQLQAVVEAVLFFNPAAWWVSSWIREERECSCDASAIRAVEGGPARYLRALLALETGRQVSVGALALTGGPLLRRVRRIHQTARGGQAGRPRDASSGAAAALLVALAVAGSGGPPPDARLAARVGAASLMLRDLDRIRLVVRTVDARPVAPPASEPARAAPTPPATRCPEDVRSA